MIACSKPRTRGAAAWSAPFVVAGLIAPVLASAVEPAPAAGNAPGAVAAASVIAKDPETGELRPATAEEMQALRQSRSALLRSAAPAGPQPKTHWSGAQGARLTDEFASYSVVVKRADGRLVELCVQGQEAATKVQAVGGGQPALPTE